MPIRVTGTKGTEESERFKAKTHRLMAASPEQIDAFVDANVTDLDSARTMFKRIIRLIRYNSK